MTGVMQDDLQAMDKLERDRGPVPTSEIAERLGVSAASATNMVKRLARLSDRRPHLLRRLADLGVLPGVALRMLAHRSGGCQIEIGGRRLTRSHALCRGVYIR